MTYLENYNLWLSNPLVDENTKNELRSIVDDNEIKERFYKNLEFGTAGLRGKVGAGTNMMNYYTVGKATQGIADFIVSKGEEYMNAGVVIAYDPRHYSKEFAQMVSCIMAGNNIKSYLFDDLRPTPELSYALLDLKCCCGVNITASHNPKEYNGYKVYWQDGAQVLDEIALPMTDCINNVDMFDGVKKADFEESKDNGLISVIGKEMDDKYIAMVKGLSINSDDLLDKTVSIVYTPLNGCGSKPVRRLLSERGFNNVKIVKEQENPDPDFTTVGYPNPEDPKAFKLAEVLGKEVDATLLIATDPDSDRLAIEVKDENGNYIPFNGNQTGFILINYIFESLYKQNKLPKNACLIKSIVTGDLGKAIVEKYGATCFESLTGFKNICGRIDELKAKGYNYVFGYEESIGYAASEKVRDKDG
ncbi:MAG: phospho-sugar mutase, partial [Erysipelotrichaceae bacterium]